jgi:kinesin family member 18/19
VTPYRVFDPPEDNPVQKFSRSVVPSAGKKVKDQVFAFDRVFDDNATQTDVYEATTKGLLDSVLDGYNATVFAYGATGCGKTHTITGTAAQPGIIFLTMQELFEKITERSDEKVTEISLSYLEIYNETIRDLLVPGGSGKQGLILREDSNQAVTVAGLTSHHPKDVQEVMDMIVQGNEYRTVSPTMANAVSSRSHAVLQINIAQKDRNADVSEPHTMATLSIIDLAGSERASATQNRGERLLEGANINKSLLALGSCINALCDPRKTSHVPYRNSKLTRLLKFSLGGNCKTVMIVCVSPSSAHFDETQNTLRYANRAKNIQTKVTRNVFNVNRHVKDFLVKIDEQMAMINELKAQQKDAEKTFFAKFRKLSEKRECSMREGMQRLRAAYDNTSTERQQKIADMKKLKTFERRIGLLTAWLAAFDAICDSREDETAMPPNLTAMRKTAQGILSELEHSRQHMHQKIDKSNWDRAIETALQHSIAQLPNSDGVGDCGEIASLTREAELLKSNFMRESYREVLEQERGGDVATMQVLLAAQFETLASLSETLAMNEEEAVTHAKGIINRLLEAGYSAASNVIKPDGSLMPVEMFPPTRRGTPKRKKTSNVQPRPIPPPAFAAVAPAQEQALMSPLKASPRRARKVQGLARKGASFSPVKKSTPRKRSVRWRDDETEEGTLADFEKTPQKFESTPEQFSPEKEIPLHQTAVPSYMSGNESGSDSSPPLSTPDAASLSLGKPSRFQAGFLSKSRGPVNGSPIPPTLSLNLSSGSDTEENTTPLRDLSISAATNHLSPQSRGSPKPTITLSPADENQPPSSDSESSGLDNHKLRSAIHSAKKARVSAIGGTATSAAKRVSSTGSNSSTHRASLAGSTNGISRQRRRSAERRRSPPIACLPSSDAVGGRDGAISRALTAGQARRMNLGGSVRVDSPAKETPKMDAKARRITIASLGASGGAAKRSSVVWR